MAGAEVVNSMLAPWEDDRRRAAGGGVGVVHVRQSHID